MSEHVSRDLRQLLVLPGPTALAPVPTKRQDKVAQPDRRIDEIAVSRDKE
jgi:hypothetical protein